jgi:transposase InsO family protein
MYKDCVDYCRNCVECAVVKRTGKLQRPPLHPIPVQRPFQIVGVDIMELPITQQGNRYVIVFQDFFTKWPLVYPAPDQKSIRIARLQVEEVVPMFGVREALLSDRGTNLLSYLMKEVCKLLGVTKLNTTAYHPACNDMVERLNRTLKATLRKHAAKFGAQWDKFLPGVLRAYRNTPHDSTHEKPSFLMFRMELRSPTEAALLPTESVEPADVSDYREQLMISLSSARELAASSIHAAQKKYKHHYDKKTRPVPFRLGDWVLVRFPQEESGKQRKLS